ncbi:hypothetical protein QJS04_geneDACA000861 [Acorus gramineus]|uniref:Uncharacterized protein n=1 Tax=Acorus gramineus TaxID=55184 RepID=A0AAV9BKK3_ACOGR|nr:hypothetical protein QJS04_geneDACA000861 [Acorus gramineus]
MTGGHAGSVVVRFFSFAGAGVFCTLAINLWRDLDRKATLKQAAATTTAPSNLVNSASAES